MIINEYIDKVFNALNDGLDDIKVIKSYPLAHKPTRMLEPIVAVSPHNMVQRAIGLGEYANETDITISVDIFVPYRNGQDVLNGIVDSICSLGIAHSIKAGEPVANKQMDCISIQLLLEFKAYIGD